MGTYQYLYLGVSVKLRYKTHDVDETKMGCPNGHGYRPNSGNFCSVCGAKVQDVTDTVSKQFTFNDMLEGGKDYTSLLPIEEGEFFNIDEDEYEYLILNRGSKHGKNLDDEYGFIDIPSSTGAEDDFIHNFRMEFFDLIEALEKYCESVEVKYGLIRYYL